MDKITTRVSEKVTKNHSIKYLHKISTIPISQYRSEIFLSGLTIFPPRAKIHLTKSLIPGI